MDRIEAALKLLQKGEVQQARVYYDSLKQQKIESKPSLLSIADLANRLGIKDDAIKFYKQIIDNNDSNQKHVAHYVLGNMYQKDFSLQNAFFHLHKAIELKPAFRNAYLKLGNLYRGTGDNETAIECYRNALKLKEDAYTLQRLLLALNYVYGLDPQHIAQEHFRYGTAFSPPVHYNYNHYDINRRRKINIGLVSGDLRLHSVSYFILPLIEKFDANRFNFFCYSNTVNKDETTGKIKKLIDNFHDIVGLSDEKTVQLINKDRIDILIDLSGHTPKNKLSVFSGRPAPIQITYLGYPNTTGTENIDYRIVDSLTDPQGSADELHTEKLIRMQHNFSCFRNLDKENIQSADSIPYEKNSYITFGSFNDISKLNDHVVQTWTRILMETPGSMLILKTKAFQSDYVKDRYTNKFKEYGLDNPARIIFMGRTPSRIDHLKTYDQIDIALDTFPYNGTTTTYQALSMGVPVITLKGNIHAGRVGYSILAHMSVYELAGDNLEDYVHKAVTLAASPDRIIRYKSTLRDIMNKTVCNEERYIREFEEVLIRLFQENLDGLHERFLPANKSCRRITVTGDLMLARRMQYHYHRKGIIGVFNDCLDIFRQSDINICNLETVVSNISSPFPKKERNPYYFRSSTYLAGLLTQAPFQVCITGNNHAMDFGGEGLAFQQNFLNTCNIKHCGAGLNEEEARKPVYLNIDGVCIAIISFVCVLPNSIGAGVNTPGVFYIQDSRDIADTLREPVYQARKNADMVIISPHWIENWETTPNTTIRKAARDLIDMGCDGIFGHSSHLLHGIEIYKNKPIFYDMGTFLVDSIAGHKELRYSAIFQVFIDQGGFRQLKIHPVLLSNGSARIAPGNARKHIFAKLLSLPNNGLEKLPLFIDGKVLTIPLESNSTSGRKVLSRSDDTVLHKSPRIRFSNQWLKQKPCAVFSSRRTWQKDFKPVPSREGFILCDAFTPRAFHTSSGFMIRVALQNVHPLNGRYEVHLRGECKIYKSVFEEYHPFANGLYGPEVWEKGENVIDETCVRPRSKVKPGAYRLFWGLKEMDSGKYVQFANSGDFAQITDQIFAMPFGINPFASGVDWDGNTPPELEDLFTRDFGVDSDANFIRYIRDSLADRKPKNSYSIDAQEVKSNFTGNQNLVYLTLFQQNGNFLRWGSGRPTLRAALNRNIEKIRSYRQLNEFETTFPAPSISI
ncbi:MAG: CapA family protein, partial [Clostridia bacterium]